MKGENSQIGEPLEVMYDRAYVAYHPETGRVAHIHRVTTYAGAEVRTEQDNEARALELTRQMGHGGELSIAPVDAAEIDGIDWQRDFLVDTNSKRIIPGEPIYLPVETAPDGDI
jgi:hypothetical protein